MKIHHILVPTDFSADAEYVLQQALVLTARDIAHVLLLHVRRRCEVVWLEGVWPTRAQIMQELQTEAEQRLQAAAAAQPLLIETLAVWGNPAPEICRIAKDYGTDLIVMSIGVWWHSCRTLSAQCRCRAVPQEVTRHG